METALKFTAFLIAGVSAWIILHQWSERLAQGWDTSHLSLPAGYQPNVRERKIFSIAITAAGLWIVALRLATSGADLQTAAVTLSLAAMMGAAAVSDIRHYLLPLPIVVCGLGLSLLLLSRGPSFLAAISGLYAIVIVAALATLQKIFKANRGLGDYLVIVWIALAAPLNGIVTTGLSMLGMALLPYVLPKLAIWRQKVSLPVGGVWLAMAVLVMAFPPYPELIYGRAAPASTLSAPMVVQLSPQKDPEQTLLNALRLQALERQSQSIGRVALAEGHAERVALARQAGAEVRQIQARYAIILTGDDQQGMARLAQALDTFDVDSVRDLSQRFAEERERLKQ